VRSDDWQIVALWVCGFASRWQPCISIQLATAPYRTESYQFKVPDEEFVKGRIINVPVINNGIKGYFITKISLL